MKRFLPFFRRAAPLLRVTNDAVLPRLHDFVGAWNEIRLGAANEASTWTRLTPYGEFPQFITENGVQKQIIQIVDREAADSMVANFRSLSTKVANFFRGIPFYEGHPDDPVWRLENPGIKAAAVGRIKELEARADGLWGRVAWNNRGLTLLDPEAPEYSGQSPHWGMNPVEGRADAYRPVVLWSSGLTNSPNISNNTIALNELGYGQPSPAAKPAEPENQETTMKLTPENLKALGFAPDATPTPEEINAAIARMLSDKATADANLTTANARVTTLNGELTTLRGSSITSALNAAIEGKKITEAERGTWENILKADFTSGSAALDKMGATTALNTESQLPKLEKDNVVISAGGIDAINNAVRAFAKENGIDVTTPEGWQNAFNACERAKPELFGGKAK